MSSVVVLQARMSSARLPGKVLMPLAGLPVVVLAARRAGNRGRRVIVATSTEPDDDAVAAVLAEQGIECRRGPLDDVLARFVGVLHEFTDDTVVARLTSDNVLPDGDLLDEVERDFHARTLDYVHCDAGLPIGLGVEFTLLRHLRHAAATTNEPYDREHVTPAIVRRFGGTSLEAYASLGKSHLRCTLDTPEDLTVLRRLFAGVDDPVGIGWRELVGRLDAATAA